jgi:putative ABC transport system permease protein
MKLLGLMLKNIRRNWIASILASAATIMLVLMVTLVWSVLSFLDQVTAEKSKDLKAIITERWQIPSQMPYSYAATLTEGAARTDDDIRPIDSMTWSFYGGTTDIKNRTLENTLFAFAMEPQKLRTMMDDLDTLPADQAADLDAAIAKMYENRLGTIVGLDRLEALGKRVGDRIKLFGINYRGIDLELEIVGTFPRGRYDKSAVIHRDYLNAAVDAWPREHSGEEHPLAQKSLNLVWIKVPDSDAFQKVADQITSSPYYSSPAVKCETASSGIGSFLDAYRDLIWGMRYLLAPACLATVAVVMSIAIGIGVRKRQMELAVMKVLGFRPRQILIMVLGESLLLGTAAGLISSWATWYLVNNLLGGIPFPIAFFPSFLIDDGALWWGPAVGGGAALLGSVWPAWSACRVKVSDVFSKVT